MEKKRTTNKEAKKSLNKNQGLHPAVRAVGYVVFAFMLIVLLASLALQSMTDIKKPDTTLFGLKYYAVTDADKAHTVIPVGSLVMVDMDARYTQKQAVLYYYQDENYDYHMGMATAAYAESLPDCEILGVATDVIPSLGHVLNFIATDQWVAAGLTFLTALVLVLLLTVKNTKGGKLKIQQRKRISIQTLWFIFTNSYMIGYTRGTIYMDTSLSSLKNFCVPGMNCYSCPGAWGSCPIGALQAVFNSRDWSTGEPRTDHYFAFYVVGLIMLFGAICGRFICGFLCPFGWIQELLAKIPVPKKLRINSFPGDKILRYLKFVVLAVFVVAMPLFIVEDIFPWFCKLICPSGMAIGGIPLMSMDAELRSAAGNFTILKLCMLAFLVILSVFMYRPFCKYLCPLGAIYGALNVVSVYKYSIDEDKCNDCGACVKTCRMGVDIRHKPNSIECIRCGDCRAVCPKQAINGGFSGFKKLPARITSNDLTIE